MHYCGVLCPAINFLFYIFSKTDNQSIQNECFNLFAFESKVLARWRFCLFTNPAVGFPFNRPFENRVSTSPQGAFS
jgi:hypothetical protein